MSVNDSCIETGKKMRRNNVGGALYGFGFIGAAIYFVQHATTFWIGALGILKAIIWPVLIVYKLLEFLKL